MNVHITSTKSGKNPDKSDAFETVVRCGGHHLFTTVWDPATAHTLRRMGPVRLQRCPVTRHWSLVTPVRSEDLTEEQRQAAAAFRDERIS